MTLKDDWLTSAERIKTPLKSPRPGQRLICPLVDMIWAKKKIDPSGLWHQIVFNCEWVVSCIKRELCLCFSLIYIVVLIRHKTTTGSVSRFFVYRWLIRWKFKWLSSKLFLSFCGEIRQWWFFFFFFFQCATWPCLNLLGVLIFAEFCKITQQLHNPSKTTESGLEFVRKFFNNE